MGAVEMLKPYLPDGIADSDGDLMQTITAYSDQGLRVLLFAHNPELVNLHNGAGEA